MHDQINKFSTGVSTLGFPLHLCTYKKNAADCFQLLGSACNNMSSLTPALLKHGLFKPPGRGNKDLWTSHLLNM